MIQPDALFLDIDGTILRSDHSLSPRVAQAISDIAEAGTLVCLATGRSWEALKPLYTQLELTGPTVCYNGAMVVEGADGRIIFEKDMDEEVARAAVDLARSRGLELVAYRHSQLLFENKGKEIRAYLKRVSIPSSAVNFDDFEQLSFTKAIIIASPELLLPVKEDLEQRFGSDKLSATYSDRRFLEMMGGGVDKGFGLREVCLLHGIDPAKSVAMGDGWNDWTLLKAAGDAWVMDGAADDLKAHFHDNRIAPSSDEDGAAIVMEAMLRGES